MNSGTLMLQVGEVQNLNGGLTNTGVLSLYNGGSMTTNLTTSTVSGCMNPTAAGGNLRNGGVTYAGTVLMTNIEGTQTYGNTLTATDKVAVIGIGGLGHMALKFLNAWGCEVTAFTSTASKKKEALSLGAHHTLNSRDENEIRSAAGRFDYILSTVNVKLDWNLYLSTLSPRGRLHFVGATLAPLNISVFSLIGAQRSVSGSPVGSPATVTKMLDFANLHQIKPEIEKFKFADINKAIERLRSGEARYRVVLCR